MDTKKLKQKILDLAVRGKLVPQDPNDEPASVLIERIRAEKEQLIKDKKIKRDKNESHIFRSGKSYYEKRGAETVCIDDEIPFEIPESWEWCRGYECYLPMTSTKPQGDIFQYIDIDAIDNKKQLIKAPKILATKNAPSRATRKLDCGDTLFSLVRPYLKNIAYIDDKYANAIASTGFYVCKPNAQILYSRYCFYIMTSQYVIDGLNSFMKGDNSPSINNDNILNWLYPIPPKSEQKRIVSEIEQSLKCVDIIVSEELKLAFAIKHTKAKVLDLAIRGKLVPQDPTDEPASVLLERIKAEKEATSKSSKRGIKKATPTTDNSHYENVPFEVPDSWVWCRLSDVCKFENGYAFNSKEYMSQGVPIIRISNINDGYVEIGECVCSDLELASRFLVQNGDLLIAMSGATTGKMGVYYNMRQAYLNQRVGNIKIVNSSIISAEYRNLVLNSLSSKILKEAYGGAQPNISSSAILQMQIPLPSLREQIRICEKVQNINNILNCIEESLQ